MSASDGGPAFPLVSTRYIGGSECTAIAEGMTLRDYFAAKAMGPAFHHLARELSGKPDADCLGALQSLAACAYAMADAMLAERAK